MPEFQDKGIIKFGNQEVVLILQTRIANALRKRKSSIHASSWNWVEAIFFAQRSLARGVIQSIATLATTIERAQPPQHPASTYHQDHSRPCPCIRDGTILGEHVFWQVKAK